MASKQPTKSAPTASAKKSIGSTKQPKPATSAWNYDSAQLAAIHKSQAVIEFNLDGTVVNANQNFLNAVGYEKEEIQGRHHRLFVDPVYANSVEYQEFWAALNRGVFRSGEFKRFAKGGKEIWIQASYNPIFDKSGKVMSVVKFATDISAEKLNGQTSRDSLTPLANHKRSLNLVWTGRFVPLMRTS